MTKEIEEQEDKSWGYGACPSLLNSRCPNVCSTFQCWGGARYRNGVYSAACSAPSLGDVFNCELVNDMFLKVLRSEFPALGQNVQKRISSALKKP
jgi:endonuclease YncB( thermonuclease family)